MSAECPSCGCKGPHRVSHTTHGTWKALNLTYTRRRRICRHCGLPFWTREVEEESLEAQIPVEPPVPDPPPKEDPGAGPLDVPQDLL